MTQPNPNPEARTVTVHRDGARSVPITFTDQGSGSPTLVLHGGGGPATVAGLAAQLARTARVITPTHPGWEGTPRPEWLASVAEIADAYTSLLAEQDLRGVRIVGSSIGGWIAAEIALRDTDGRVTSLVLIDSGGIEVENEPMRDIFTLDPRGVAEYS
ncbi:MAG: alpha/beta fold hydrolase, partial [Actinocrinis sp.]